MPTIRRIAEKMFKRKIIGTGSAGARCCSLRCNDKIICFWAGSRPFPATPMTAGHPDCRRDLMDCTSYAPQQETALRRKS